MSVVRARRVAWLAAAVCCVPLAGCGIDTGEGAGGRSAVNDEQNARAQLVARQQRAARLPARPAGKLAITGEYQGSLSSNAVKAFSDAQTEVQPSYDAVGATEGFARLCRGEVDIVDSARQISRAELALCVQNGLDIRPPIQIASDAIVLATRNESDIGGDCLSVADVGEVYRRGSTVTNWRQLGFDDLALKATGPEQDANAFSSFASLVLGETGGATLGDLRADYRSHGSDAAIRNEIVGEDGVRRVPDRVAREVRAARRAQAGARRDDVQKAAAKAEDRVLATIRARNRSRARRKQAVRDPHALAARNLRRVKAARERAADRAGARFDRRFDDLRTTRTRELLATARRTGVVGFVRFADYEAYEDVLRPLEIDPGAARDVADAAADKRLRDAGETPPPRLAATDAKGNRIPNCIFPSQQTITTGEYPLSRRILLYTSTRALRRPETRSFLAYALLHAQDLATGSRLVPITNLLRARQYKLVTGKEISRSSPSTSSTTPAPTQTTSPSDSAASAAGSGVPGVSSGLQATQKESP